MPNFYTDVLMKSPRFDSPERISDPAMLDPVMREKVDAVINDASAHGLHLAIFETYRSIARQEILAGHPGATELRSNTVHHYGLACDLVFLVAGEPSWKPDFTILGHLAKAHGLIWGGDWGAPNRPHRFVDDDHVQFCSVADQAKLFRGEWYPAADYNPYA